MFHCSSDFYAHKGNNRHVFWFYHKLERWHYFGQLVKIQNINGSREWYLWGQNQHANFRRFTTLTVVLVSDRCLPRPFKFYMLITVLKFRKCMPGLMTFILFHGQKFVRNITALNRILAHCNLNVVWSLHISHISTHITHIVHVMLCVTDACFREKSTHFIWFCTWMWVVWA